jgi:quinol monooxygenase YgiN
MDVIPEKQLEFTQTLLSMVKPAENEAGCVSYAAYSDICNKNRFNLLGQWNTRQALDNHIKSYRFGILLGSKTLLTHPLEIEILTISTNEGMDTIHRLRKKPVDFDNERSHQ